MCEDCERKRRSLLSELVRRMQAAPKGGKVTQEVAGADEMNAPWTLQALPGVVRDIKGWHAVRVLCQEGKVPSRDTEGPYGVGFAIICNDQVLADAKEGKLPPEVVAGWLGKVGEMLEMLGEFGTQASGGEVRVIAMNRMDGGEEKQDLPPGLDNL